MLEAHWFSLVGGASLLTLAWLFIPSFVPPEDARIPTTSLLACAMWFYAGLTGGELSRITETGTVAVEASALQYVALAFGVLSLLAFLLYQFDEYPPHEPAANYTPNTAADMEQ